MEKKKIKFLLLSTIPVLSMCINVNAQETIQISNQNEYFDAIATINASAETDFIVNLSDDITLTAYPSTTSPTTITNNKKVTFLGNGYKIKISDTGSYGYHEVLTIGNATVNLGKSGEINELSIEGGGETVSTSESLINVSGTLNMYKGVSLSDNYSGNGALTGGAVRIQNNGTFNMYDGKIHDNASTSTCIGGALALTENNATFNMYGGSIENNQTCAEGSAWGGAIFMDEATATVNIEGGTFKNNKSVYGGVLGVQAGTVTMKNVTFEDNQSLGGYGGVAISYYDSSITGENITFKNNTSKFGSAFAVYGGDVSIKNSTFEGNSATSSGGAILNAAGTYTSENNTYKNNTANYGGAIRSQDTIISKNDTITANTAKTGGGIYINGGSMNFKTSDIYNNKAETSANDIYITSSVTSVDIKDASTMNKTATFDDGTVGIDGWYTDASDARYTVTTPTEKVVYSTIVAGNTYYLTAAGSEEQVVIKFNPNNGTTMDDLTLEKGASLASITTPTKEGYEFAGWYTDENFENKFNLNTSINSNITLYAKWNYVYKILSGSDQTFDENNLVIVANGNINNISSIKVNDEEIDYSKYSLEDDNVTLTLNKDYLKTLSAGTYRLKITYNDGEVETTFTIPEDDTTSNSTSDNIKAPKTGDNISKYVILLITSIFGIALSKKKKERLQ